MLTCHVQLKMKSKTQCPLIYRLFVKIKNLPLLSTANQFLVTFINILRTFYHLRISLVLSTHSLYTCFRICSSWTKLHPESLSLKQIFLKMATLKCFKKFIDNIHVVKDTTLTVEKKPFVLVPPFLGSISL